MKKVAISAALVLIFIISYCLYLYVIATYRMHDSTGRLWNYYSLGFLIFGIWIMEAKRVDTILQESILRGGKLLVLLCFLNIILTQHLIIKDPYTNLKIFMAGSGLALSILLFEIIKLYNKLWALVAAVFFPIFLFSLL